MTCRNNEIYEFLHTLLNLSQNTTREEKVCNFTCCVVKLSEFGVNTFCCDNAKCKKSILLTVKLIKFIFVVNNFSRKSE